MNTWQSHGSVESYPSTMFRERPVYSREIGLMMLTIKRATRYVGSPWKVYLEGKQQRTALVDEKGIVKQFPPADKYEVKPPAYVIVEAEKFARRETELLKV